MSAVIQQPIYKTALAWVLLLPVLFFIAGGTLSLDRPTTGINPTETESVLNPNPETPYFMMEQSLMYAIVLGVMAFSFKSTLNLALRYPLVFSLPLYALTSVLWTQSASRTLSYSLFALILTMFGVFLADRFAPDRLIEFLLFAGWVAIILSFGAIIFYPAAGIWKDTAAGAWRGMYVHKQNLGGETVFMLIPAFFSKPKNQVEKAGLCIYCLLSVILIVGSQSRTAWIMFIVSMAAIGFLKLTHRLPNGERMLLIVATILVVTSLTVVLVAYYREIALTLGKDPTLTGRTLIWAACWEAIKRRPLLGLGYRAFWLALRGEAFNIAASIGQPNLGNSENGVLETWLELGIGGVTVLVITMFQSLRKAVRVFGQRIIPLVAGWYIMVVFWNLLTFVNGGKFMPPHSFGWPLFVIAYIGLDRELKAKRVSLAMQRTAATSVVEVG